CRASTAAAAARNRRFARLRRTAFPTFRLAVKPTRTASTPLLPRRLSGGRAAACSTKPGLTARRRPAATRRKSARVLSPTSPFAFDIGIIARLGPRRCGAAREFTQTGAVKQTGACDPWHAARPAPDDRLGWPFAHESHGAACGSACSAGKCVSRHPLQRKLPWLSGGRYIGERSRRVNECRAPHRLA